LIPVRFLPVRACLIVTFLLMIAAEVSAQALVSGQDIPENEGGVLTLHHYAGIDAESFEGDCSLLRFSDLSEVNVSGLDDGSQHLIAIHMSFPDEQPLAIAGATFGIDFTDNMNVVRYGFCKTPNGIVLPDGTWPMAESNVGIYFGPSATTNHFLVAWFIVTSDGPGSFSAVPHSDPGAGAAFANPSGSPHLAAVTGFGRIGFGATNGVVPVPGEVMPRGVCCISEGCASLSNLACDYYGGLYLGEGTDCQSGPCAPDAAQGACCLLDGCNLLTRRDCFIQAGQFLGEGTTCDEADCAAGVWVDGGDD